MTNRKWKYLALAAAGGVMLQAAGCAQLMTEALVSLIPTIISELLSGALAGTTQ